MNKIITLICSFVGLISTNINYCQSNSNSELKKMFIGDWQLFDDKKFVMSLPIDKLIYKYNGKITDKNPITYLFMDDSRNFSKNKNKYDFRTDKIINKNFIIKEYDIELRDTLISYILYIDDESLEMASQNRYVTFKRIKTCPSTSKKKGVKSR